MSSGTVSDQVPAAGADLPALAMSRPIEAERAARSLLATSPRGVPATYALQALGIVARDRGDLDDAVAHLRRARRIAAGVGRRDRASDVSATLGTALAMAGRAPEALSLFRGAIADSQGVMAARIRVRGAAALVYAGRHREALEMASAAIPVLRRSRDTTWLSRAYGNRAEAMLRLGLVSQAQADLARDLTLLERADLPYEAAINTLNRAEAAALAGQLPEALALHAEAARRFDELGVRLPEASTAAATTLLIAGLPDEALIAGREALRCLEGRRGAESRRARVEVVTARTAFLAGEVAEARLLASRAARRLRRDGELDSACAAALVAIQADRALGKRPGSLLSRASGLADELDRQGSPLTVEAALTAGRLAEDAGRGELALALFDRAARHRYRGSALPRAIAWTGAALASRARNDRAGTLRACRSGLRLLDAHRVTLGATELRASATGHGRELAAIATRTVARDGSARELLTWSERWRATVLDAPARPPDDPLLASAMAELREVSRQARDGDPVPLAVLEAERSRLEGVVLERTRATRATQDATGSPRSVVDALASVAPGTTLVSVLRVDDNPLVVVVRDGRARRFEVGRRGDVGATSDHLRFALRSAARGDSRTAAAMGATLADQAARLQDLLLGPAAAWTGDGPVVLLPPARLQSVPWTALPVFTDRPVSVSPSLSSWHRSCEARRPGRRRVALVCGPQLGTAGAEVPELVRAYDVAAVLGGGTATCDATMKALDGAWLGHVAAHGTIRTDNPMFSALELDDGPLTVYDLERLRRAPYRLVLSVCESAVGAATGADELLGLSSALIGLGTAGLLASIVPVNDEATVPFSLTIHERLRAGDDLATALLHARRAAGDDPVARATAYSFLALGAA